MLATFEGFSVCVTSIFGLFIEQAIDSIKLVKATQQSGVSEDINGFDSDAKILRYFFVVDEFSFLFWLIFISV